MSSALRVSVLAYPGCFASQVYGVLDLLTMAGHVAAAQGRPGPSYRVTVVSPRRRVTASGGAGIEVAALRPADVLIVPGFETAPGPGPGAGAGAGPDFDGVLARLGPETAAVRAQAQAGGALVSVCVGAFLLAEAGLLHAREATTSWLYADQFARRYPQVRLRPQELVVSDGGVTTTAAFSAMYDFALRLIREHDGPRIARSTARITLLDDARSTQSAYVDTELLPAVGRGFSPGVKRWLEQNLQTRYDLPALAREFGVSTRTLLRRFGQETGLSPLAYLHTARVRRAKHLLETTERTIASVAAEVGYRDPGGFSEIFARHTGHRPSAYRAAFRRPAQDPEHP
ncbi:GlxA family transcriptional regulator [Streptomyces sp. NPDC058284]|uniref:GlxA family transcriptional regulator n=1 Tax=unclassified Streptomyces TaxID=2593676 RepID=UPI00366770B3